MVNPNLESKAMHEILHREAQTKENHLRTEYLRTSPIAPSVDTHKVKYGDFVVFWVVTQHHEGVLTL